MRLVRTLPTILCLTCMFVGLVQAEEKNILFIAGEASHGFAAHEHRAGCLLLAKSLREGGVPGIQIQVVTGGWPNDDSVFEDIDCLVMYCDGGRKHLANSHFSVINLLANQGVGIVCLHYGVEVPKGESGDRFLRWIGGYFETHWSVNPSWTPNFTELGDHPISRGVEPFEIFDEWYYHMRFRPSMKNVTPILSDLPPSSTLERKDGAHSGNPAVRTAVLQEKAPQHVAWAADREGGGRGFGFTGGHFHWNWGNNNFRRLVCNAVLWCAEVEVPTAGVPLKNLTVDDLLSNQDYPPPENFDRTMIEKKLLEWNHE